MTPDAVPLAKAIGRRVLVALAALAGVGVVVISWRVPEPPPSSTPRQVENMSYLKYTPVQAPPPNYGTR